MKAILENKIFVAALLLCIMALFLAAHPSGKKNIRAKERASKYVEGEVIIKFRDKAQPYTRSNKILSMGNKIQKKKHKNVRDEDFDHVKLKEGLTVQDAIKQYENDPDVEYVQPNYIYHISTTPNDTAFSSQWGFKNTNQTIANATYATNNPPGIASIGMDIDMESAWDKITNCETVTVAVVDTGVNYAHEDLAANMWNGGASYPNHGYNFVNGNDDPKDLNGHGTHIAGTIGAVGNNSKGTAGVCWSVKIMAVRVLDEAGTGTSSNIVSGIYFASGNGARVINLSLGNYSYDQAMYNAIDNARSKGVVVVAAAGNTASGGLDMNGTSKTYPCSFDLDNIVCVAALDQKYELADFSNYGSSCVHVGAPGTNIKSTFAGTEVNYTTTFLDWTKETGWARNTTFLPTVDLLSNPSNFDYNSSTALYSNGLNSKAYKSNYALTGSEDSILLSFYYWYELEDSVDNVKVYYKNSGDPTAGGTLLDTFTGLAGPKGYLYYTNYIIASGLTNLSAGFLFASNSSLVKHGIAIADFNIRTLTIDYTTYYVSTGTSMAAPHASGLAAMLFAYNPDYIYSDVVKSIKHGGEDVSALANKTVTGKAVNAWGSLKYISPPEGASVVGL